MTLAYCYGSYTKFKVEYPFVWLTKYCKQVLVEPVVELVGELIRQTYEMLEVEILRGVVSKDHLYMIVTAPPDISPQIWCGESRGEAQQNYSRSLRTSISFLATSLLDPWVFLRDGRGTYVRDDS